MHRQGEPQFHAGDAPGYALPQNAAMPREPTSQSTWILQCTAPRTADAGTSDG